MTLYPYRELTITSKVQECCGWEFAAKLGEFHYSPFREAGEAHGERPGIVYPLLPRTTCPDTRLSIDAATLPESDALSRQSWIWRKRNPERRRTSRHPSLDVSSANAVATARRSSTGHPSTRRRKVAGVNKHPPAINKGDLL